MPRSRFESEPLGRPPFFDRVRQTALVYNQLSSLHSDPERLQVLAFVGLGGIGKTRLLDELWHGVGQVDPPVRRYWVSLAAEGSGTEVGPLLNLREQTGFDCLLFDTALLMYWTAMGQPLNRDHGQRLRNSLAVQTVQTMGAALGTPLPLSFALGVFQAARQKATRLLQYHRSEFEEIDELRRQPRELLDRLPHYLGLDIQRRLDHRTRPVVAFFDGYDRQRSTTRAQQSPWLRELIASIGSGLFLISTREPLRWDLDEWGEVLGHVSVDQLPIPESRDLIQAQLGPVSELVADYIIDVSRRIPFFLGAMINSYAVVEDREGQVSTLDLPSTPQGAVYHLLDHLEDAERVLTVGLATIQVFDERFFAHLVRALDLRLGLSAFEDFTNWFFVEPLGEGLYKTHDLLTDLVQTSGVDDQTKVRALESCATYILGRCRGDGLNFPDEVLVLFRAAMSAWQQGPPLPTRSVEEIVDAGYLLYDAGYWNELADLLPWDRTATDPSRIVSRLFTALAVRRSSGPLAGLEMLGTIEESANALGRHRASLELEMAYMSEIAGNYQRARQEFRELSERSDPFDPSDRTHVRSRLYYSDMLIMDGFFQQGSRLLLETYETIGAQSVLDWCELVRHRGHAFRFSVLLEQAEGLYLRALHAASDAPALQAKLWTNMAETLCWLDSERALQAASRSAELNLRVDNQIELVKCRVARGIAYARQGDWSAGLDTLDTAVTEGVAIGYPAGAAFAHQAASMVHAWNHDREASMERLSKLRRIIDALGTYRYLLLAPLWLLGEDVESIALIRDCDWLSTEDVGERLTAAFGTFGLCA